MEEERKGNLCYKKVRTKCLQPDPNNPDKKCFKRILAPCKKRCVDGKISNDMPGRPKGSPCKDAE